MSELDNNRKVLDLLEKEYAKAKGKKEDKITFKLKNVSEIIDWKEIRPNLTEDFINNTYVSNPELSAENIPFINQERQLISDILVCFLGGSGCYIKAEPILNRSDVRNFKVNPQIDIKLYEMVKNFTPLAKDYSYICRFIEDNRMLSVGRVNQALAGSLNITINEFKRFVVEMENLHLRNKLNLTSLRYHMQNIIETFKILNNIAFNVTKSGLRGGATLTYLFRESSQEHSMDSHSTLFKTLIKKSSKPFFESVKEWIFNGVIFDPFDEFMIVEKTNLSFKDCHSLEHWEKKYQTRNSNIPSFLIPYANEIWKSGVYLNVIRYNILCPSYSENSKLNLATIEDLNFSWKDYKYVEVIKRAYIHASSNLLYYMMNRYNLEKRFLLMKHYFLVQQGDFVVQVLDTCNEELSKPVLDIIPSRLKTLVDMAIRGIEGSLRDDITISFQPYDLWHQVNRILSVNSSIDQEQKNVSLNTTLTGYESFTLDINCKWPVSFLFNTRIISCYQMLFRLLFYCKHVEQCLFKAWMIDQKLRKISSKNLEKFSLFFALRHKMVYFLQNIQNYMMEEAVEPNWIDFHQQLKVLTEQTEVICKNKLETSKIYYKVYSIDDLLEIHKKFLDKCINDCLLSNSTIFPIYMKLISLCKEFSNLICENENNLLETSNDVDDSFFKEVENLEKQFQNHYKLFLSLIVEFGATDSTSRILEILHRANFNSYFTVFPQDNSNSYSLDD